MATSEDIPGRTAMTGSKLRHGRKAAAGLVLGTLTMLLVPYTAASQQFPTSPIRIVVPTAPSTPPDIISRVIAAELSESEGWKVFVENKPGAVLTIGGSEVLRHPADGH